MNEIINEKKILRKKYLKLRSEIIKNQVDQYSSENKISLDTEIVNNLIVEIGRFVTQLANNKTYQNNLNQNTKIISDRIRKSNIINIGLYYSINDEVSIKKIYENKMLDDLKQKITNIYGTKIDIKFALPCVYQNQKYLTFREFIPEQENCLAKEEFFIPQPTKNYQEVVPEIVIVPALAFDVKGYRLGYGKGFYDATFDLWNRLIVEKEINTQQIENNTQQIGQDKKKQIMSVQKNQDFLPYLIGIAYHFQLDTKYLPVEQHDVAVNVIVSEQKILYCN